MTLIPGFPALEERFKKAGHETRDTLIEELRRRIEHRNLQNTIQAPTPKAVRPAAKTETFKPITEADFEPILRERYGAKGNAIAPPSGNVMRSTALHRLQPTPLGLNQNRL